MNLRAATISDAEQLAALIISHRALLTLDPEGHGAERFFESVSEPAIRSYIASDRYDYTVLESNKKILGFIAIRDQSHLFHLFVAREHRGKGIGRQLWESALGKADASQNQQVFTVNSSLNAVAVYRKFGFKEVSARVEAHGVAYIPMARSLATMP
jgi:ribosomal protein S18 acetylase RimI-like enzyme